MQTFLPLPTSNFAEIAKRLDNKRLHKQALEAWQIAMVLLKLDPEGNHRDPKGWVNHPAVKMWEGHELVLLEYAFAMAEEWKSRGFKTSLMDKISDTAQVALLTGRLSHIKTYPSWMLDGALYAEIASSHRQALLVKDYEWYSQFGWEEDKGTEPNGYTYVWPTEKEMENA